MLPAKAFIVAPPTAPVLYWVTSVASALADPNRRNAALHNPLMSLVMVLAFGAPIAYAATLVFGVPVYWFLNRRNALRAAPIVATGAVAGLVTALVVEPQFRGELFSIPLGPWRGMALGAATAVVFWWFSRTKRGVGPR